MDRPRIAFSEPVNVDLEPGLYWWCQCGQSQSQPFCDGSHKVQGIFKPVVMEIEKPVSLRLCQCKQTANAPYCDDTHLTLPR